MRHLGYSGGIFMNFEMHRRAQDALAQGSLTNSKRAECFVKGVYPTHIKRAQGPFVWDMDGNRYIDFICGLGTNLIGYANPHVNKALHDQMEQGWLASLPMPIEVEAAEKIKSLFPFIDKVRFFKEGTTACMTAIRVARAKTDRTRVLVDGYHGHADPYLYLTPPAAGVPIDLNVEKLKSLDQITQSVAAVVVEPVITDWSDDRLAFLTALQDKCKTTGTMLIFDEIITGFRWPGWSVATKYGYRPDIICLGKACAGGMPLSILGFKEGVADTNPEWFGSGTFYSDALSLRAMMATIDYLTNKVKIDDLWERSKRFLLEFNKSTDGVVSIEGYPTRGVFSGDPVKKAIFWQEACRAGLLFGPSFFVSFDHADYFSQVLSFAQDISPKIKTCKISLKGDLPQSPFADKVRRQDG